MAQSRYGRMGAAGAAGAAVGALSAYVRQKQAEKELARVMSLQNPEVKRALASQGHIRQAIIDAGKTLHINVQWRIISHESFIADHDANPYASLVSARYSSTPAPVEHREETEWMFFYQTRREYIQESYVVPTSPILRSHPETASEGDTQ